MLCHRRPRGQRAVGRDGVLRAGRGGPVRAHRPHRGEPRTGVGALRVPGDARRRQHRDEAREGLRRGASRRGERPLHLRARRHRLRPRVHAARRARRADLRDGVLRPERPAFTLGPQNYGVDSYTGKGACFNAACTKPGIWGGTSTSRTGHGSPTATSGCSGDFELDVHAKWYQRADPAIAYTAYNNPNEFERDRFLSADIAIAGHLVHRAAALAPLRRRLSYQQQLPAFAAFQCGTRQLSCTYEGLGYSRWLGLEEQLMVPTGCTTPSLTTLVGVDGRAIRAPARRNDSERRRRSAAGPPPSGVFRQERVPAGRVRPADVAPAALASLNVGARYDEDRASTTTSSSAGSRRAPSLR